MITKHGNGNVSEEIERIVREMEDAGYYTHLDEAGYFIADTEWEEMKENGDSARWEDYLGPWTAPYMSESGVYYIVGAQ